MTGRPPMRKAMRCVRCDHALTHHRQRLACRHVGPRGGRCACTMPASRVRFYATTRTVELERFA